MSTDIAMQISGLFLLCVKITATFFRCVVKGHLCGVRWHILMDDLHWHILMGDGEYWRGHSLNLYAVSMSERVPMPSAA